MQVVIDYMAVVLCMADSVDDEHRTHCASSSSPSVTLRSARFLSHASHRHQRTRVSKFTELSSDPGHRGEFSPVFTWQHRRGPPATVNDYYRNGRPMTRYSDVILRQSQESLSLSWL